MSMKHAILGLLDLAPMTGYDLKKNFDATVAHFWSADQSQIYRTLSGLVDGGLASVSVVEQSSKPNRNVHSITEQGRAALDDWLRSPLEQQPTREPFLARLFFAGRMGADRVSALLDERRAAAAAQLAALRALQQQESATSDLAARLRLATLDNGIAHTQSELDWLDELTATLAAAPITTPTLETAP
nr:PadR family transcriptional regulator [Salinibacterium sp. ZJ450]